MNGRKKRREILFTFAELFTLIHYRKPALSHSTGVSFLNDESMYFV